MSADVALVTLSLSGDAEAQRQLAMRVLDVVHRVVWSRMAGDAELRETIGTRVQEVFVALLERDAEDLRQWDPDDGPSLEECVEELAGRRIDVILAGRPAPADEAPKWAAPRGQQRDAILAKILARLDQGETLAEDVHARDLDAPLDAPTRPDVQMPTPPEDRPSAWRPTPMHIAATVLVAVAIASAIAMWAG